MDALLFVVSVITALCMGRYSLDLNPELEEWVRKGDDTFRTRVASLSNKQPSKAVDAAGTFFGFLAIIHFGLSFLAGLVRVSSPVWWLYVSTVFLYSTLAWVAVKWFTKYERFSLPFLKDMSVLPLYTLVFPVLDALAGTPSIMPAIHGMLTTMAGMWGIAVPQTANVWLQAVEVTALMEAMVVLYWFLSTALFIPIAVSALVVVSVPIYVARSLNKIAFRRPLTPFCFFVWIAVAGYDWFK